MRHYLELLEEVALTGLRKKDRTSVGTRSLFGRQLRFDLNEGFPILTTKLVHFHSVATELQWMLEGRTDIGWLNDRGVTIWDEWANEDGQLGPVYGEQWRNWPHCEGGSIDQIRQLITGLKTNPDSRRHIVTAWNPMDLPDETVSPRENVAHGLMALAPCHCLFQFYVGDGLSCHLYQRSADLFLGVPFNIASYALLTHMIAEECEMQVGELIISFGDVHLYEHHMTDKIVFEQLRRTPRALPMLELGTDALDCPPGDRLYTYKPTLIGYDPLPAIPAPIAI